MNKAVREWAEKTFGLTYLDELRLYLAWGVVEGKGEPVVRDFVLRFWRDPAYFTAMCRAGVVALGSAITSGIIVFPVGSKLAWYAGVFATAAALLFPAGQSNPKPEEIKAIAHDPAVGNP